MAETITLVIFVGDKLCTYSFQGVASSGFCHFYGVCEICGHQEGWCTWYNIKQKNSFHKKEIKTKGIGD